ncbi:hypothetical protein GCM10023093_05050 [Nemorincola caseinilytica]|uniref:4'-phosphopantetheinyl transferase domain-containing protein n=1 Tax=Nemorincola caseinilytica TaxID=2054315 RepID=A0ABP8N745_9BACT
MPLLREWDISDSGLAAVWKIEEAEAFFTGHTGLYPEINNEKRRMEHLAGRYLLRHLERDFPLHRVVRDQHNKPRLDDNSFYFSVSHSWPYAAAILDTREDTGIDIQMWTPRIVGIQQKFLSEAEQAFCRNDHRLITLAWCAKEAVYKWHGKKGLVSFMEHLPITYLHEEDGICEARIDFQLAEVVPLPITLRGYAAADHGCMWVQQVGSAAI